ncbi:cyclin dependent kinase inhibitor family protein [Striga asiatica]|uniref:Cyclin dependent kinase inhibitor family protein n=1 Tax=Striga asiatica TaxID=4170 RepID=A0A5A7QAX4_STRAF|nr:cyclin dependent kinase inhibitor family protein [Striga asiatica]
MAGRLDPPRVELPLAIRPVIILRSSNGIAMCPVTVNRAERDQERERDMSVTMKAWRMVAAEEDVELISSKKRKLYSELSGEVEPSPENPASPAASRTSGGFYEYKEFSSDVAKKGSSDLEDVDLQSKVVEKEISTSTGRIFSGEPSPTSEFYGDSEQVSLQSVSMAKSKKLTPPSISRRKIATYSPPPAELEEFFAAAEKHDQKRFLEKYNYDIVRDVPLEGKYQWVRLHP